MKIDQLDEGVGRIVKGVNTTPDVGVDQVSKEAAKFGFNVDKDGRPPVISKKSKNSPNTLFNLGLTESVKLQFQRGEDFDTLHIKPKNKNRLELRGKPGYERGNHDPQDKLHQVLDRLGKAANFAELMNGEVVTINPKHPDGERAKNTVDDVLSTENTGDLFNALEEAWSAIEENFADGKKKGKSRPGRVKRAGASCKGSVTSLRKRAKKASGERAKMYHWCSNMKAGRKKNK